jgi:putative tryptophan/tyrosine transport system substrate-binding protein
MRRREFITLIGGGGVAARGTRAATRADAAHRRAHALRRDRSASASPQRGIPARIAAIGLDCRAQRRNRVPWSGGNIDDTRKYAAELVALAPDVIFVPGSAAVAPLRQATRAVPIVFALVADPVGSGFVDSLARPGGNVTGFSWVDYGIGAKWLELLKEIAPNITRAAVLRDPAIIAGIGQWGAIQSASPSVAIEVSPVNIDDAEEIERSIAAFARSPNGGLILTGSAFAILRRDLIIALAARHKLPAIYYDRYFVAVGGLMSYGPDNVNLFRRAASYVDRILKGEKPSDLPVQQPTKYDLVINLKTARALGLELPPTLLARADEVIE